MYFQRSFQNYWLWCILFQNKCVHFYVNLVKIWIWVSKTLVISVENWRGTTVEFEWIYYFWPNLWWFSSLYDLSLFTNIHWIFHSSISQEWRHEVPWLGLWLISRGDCTLVWWLITEEAQAQRSFCLTKDHFIYIELGPMVRWVTHVNCIRN